MEDRHLATSINSTNELFLAIFYDNIPLVETLLAQGVNANANSQVFFDREKATKANEELLDDVVSIFSSVSDTSGNQYPRRFIGSALEAALYCGNCDAAKLLLEYGANSTTSPTEASWTAFMSPVCCGNLELIRILHRHRDDRYQNLFCHDTLNVAVESGQQEIVKFFLECGVDVHVDTLELSAKYPDSEIFSLLLESKADLDSSSYDKALLAAVWNKNPKMVRLLLGQGANVNACNSVGSPCLHIAAYLGDEKTIELLLKNGADIDSQGWPCGNALHAAAMGINQDTVNFLIGHGANITIQPLMEARKSLLHSVVEKDSIATVMALCGNGGDVYLDTQDERGHTPLHCAVINQDTRMVRYLLDRGASPDLPDFENMSPLKLALKKRLRDIVLLLYRKSKADPSSVTASELRWCSQFGDRCNLEIVGDQQPRLFFRDENLIYGLRSLRKKKYNGTLLEGQESIEIEELDLHRKERRAYVVTDYANWQLDTRGESAFSCRWWEKNARRGWNVIIESSSAPTQNMIRQAKATDYCLACRLFITCCVLRPDPSVWPSAIQLSGQTEGILWIMKKPMPDDVDSLSAKSTLQSQVFFSSSEYAVIPRFAIDLLPPMMDKIEGIWKKNFSVFSNRLASMRSEVLMASGENPDLIRELLRSTRLLETLKDNLAEETEKLAKFADQYLDESSKTIHEMPFKEVKARITHFSNRIKQLQKYASQQFRNIYNSCQELIQLEFNLTSIAEAQKSTSTNRSIKRLTWITFIFLPLLFISSLFGMNVDLFKDNPGWWWYPVIACSTTLLTMGVWITFKRSNALEDKLERRFRFLFRSKNRENDHEMALRQGWIWDKKLGRRGRTKQTEVVVEKE